jgi:hypothetical protein
MNLRGVSRPEGILLALNAVVLIALAVFVLFVGIE